MKLRKRGGIESASAAVTYAKQANICRVSDYYRKKNAVSPDTGIRYDVIAIGDDDISWYKNAFDYSGKGY